MWRFDQALFISQNLLTSPKCFRIWFQLHQNIKINIFNMVKKKHVAEYWINFLVMTIHGAWLFFVHQMSLSPNYSDMKVILTMIYRSFAFSLLANFSNEITTLRSGHVYSTGHLLSHSSHKKCVYIWRTMYACTQYVYRIP